MCAEEYRRFQCHRALYRLLVLTVSLSARTSVSLAPIDAADYLEIQTDIDAGALSFDVHCGKTVCSGNGIDKAFIVLKATHGARSLAITNNLLSGVDLWGILLNPGTGSHTVSYTEKSTDLDSSNVDGGILVANNVISDFGEGNDFWYLGDAHDDRGSSYGIAIQAAQLTSNLPLRDILIQGNVVYDTQSTQSEQENVGADARPKYRYAVHIEPGDPKPRNIRFSGNLFAPSTQGVSNVEIP